MELDYEFNLPIRTYASRLSAMGHPGYSESFAKRVITFYEHNGNIFHSIRIAHNIVDRDWGR